MGWYTTLPRSSPDKTINYLSSLHATDPAVTGSEESCSIQWSSPYLAGESLQPLDLARDGVPNPLSLVVSVGHIWITGY